MNREKVIRQFEVLIMELKRHTEQVNNPVCREKRFDPQLFSNTGNRLSDYLRQLSDNLVKLSQLHDSESPMFRWLSQRMLDQSQAIQRELSSLETRASSPLTAASYWQNKYQQQQGYEIRLSDMIAQHEQQLNCAETLQQQQAIAEKINVLEQRLARCRTALRESYWQSSLRQQP